jgi:hypothetical protein
VDSLRRGLDAPCLGVIRHLERPDAGRASGTLSLLSILRRSKQG